VLEGQKPRPVIPAKAGIKNKIGLLSLLEKGQNPSTAWADLKSPVKGCEVKTRNRIAIFSTRKAGC
jgi:hypothetical protein